MMTQFTVLGAPQGKERPRVAKLRDRTIVYTPKKTKDYEREIATAYLTQCRGVFSGAVSVTICAYFQIPKSTSRKRVLEMLEDEIKPTKKPDADNIAKAVCDALNGIAYKDDSCVVQLNVEKFYAKEPYIRVYISEA